MSNAFEKAKKKMDEQPVGTEADVVETQEAPETHSNNRKRQTLDEDSIQSVEWIKAPSEIGEESEVLTVIEGYQQEGRMVQIKNGPKKGKSFWSGLTSKDNNGNPKNDDEFGIECEEGNFQLKSWELVSKFKSFLRYCKHNKHTSKGQTLVFVRMAKGADTAGTNWIIKSPSLGIKIGEDNEITKLEE